MRIPPDSDPGSAAARGPCDGPRPGTGSGPGQCEWPPATAHPTVRASARGAPGHHPALGAANAPAARRAPSATSPTVRHTSSRPSPRRRRGGARLIVASASLKVRCAGKQLNLHRQLPMWRLAASSSAASRPAPSDPAHTGQRTGLPRLQAIDLQTDFSRDRIKRLAAQQPQNHVPFPACAPPLAGRQGPRPNRRAVGADSRPPGSLRPRRPNSLASTQPCPPPPLTSDSPRNPCPRKLRAPQFLPSWHCSRQSVVSRIVRILLDRCSLGLRLCTVDPVSAADGHQQQGEQGRCRRTRHNWSPARMARPKELSDPPDVSQRK